MHTTEGFLLGQSVDNQETVPQSSAPTPIEHTWPNKSRCNCRRPGHLKYNQRLTREQMTLNIGKQKLNKTLKDWKKKTLTLNKTEA